MLMFLSAVCYFSQNVFFTPCDARCGYTVDNETFWSEFRIWKGSERIAVQPFGADYRFSLMFVLESSDVSNATHLSASKSAATVIDCRISEGDEWLKLEPKMNLDNCRICAGSPRPIRAYLARYKQRKIDSTGSFGSRMGDGMTEIQCVA